MACQRANDKDIAADCNSAELGDAADIDDQIRRYQTQVDRGQQTLSACKQLRSVPVRNQ